MHQKKPFDFEEVDRLRERHRKMTLRKFPLRVCLKKMLKEAAPQDGATAAEKRKADRANVLAELGIGADGSGGSRASRSPAQPLRQDAACGLCEVNFAKACFVSQVSRKSVDECRHRWGVPTLPVSAYAMYSAVPLCAFCSQFFSCSPARPVSPRRVETLHLPLHTAGGTPATRRPPDIPVRGLALKPQAWTAAESAPASDSCSAGEGRPKRRPNAALAEQVRLLRRHAGAGEASESAADKARARKAAAARQSLHCSRSAPTASEIIPVNNPSEGRHRQVPERLSTET
ncbi:hypothetical protein DIPPA_33058 [Diplonema papillatum]|nr:hypothetical protein DIPPA_33058 [Diplonema papillatum]KAJ9458214.1 hypothetical protein DIPPA_33058 [Diplonema papillatum]